MSVCPAVSQVTLKRSSEAVGPGRRPSLCCSLLACSLPAGEPQKPRLNVGGKQPLHMEPVGSPPAPARRGGTAVCDRTVKLWGKMSVSNDEDDKGLGRVEAWWPWEGKGKARAPGLGRRPQWGLADPSASAPSCVRTVLRLLGQGGCPGLRGAVGGQTRPPGQRPSIPGVLGRSPKSP